MLNPSVLKTVKSKIHVLSVPDFKFQQFLNGNHNYDIRDKNTGYLIGDYILYQEKNMSFKYTGRSLYKIISSVVEDSRILNDGCVILGFSRRL
ncbi:DUF3850 domain-containing protein [Dehalobacter sp.]|uniref:DUF3850 domain-containing protein n=1 Tax=Dehalobacter sp. TaxID=1962289 RepID=UPI002590B8AE|nr:DUF3850 domain-containing protein [Dehalobacter sp.]MDJ0304546.1 DUF3850 domain-containing protein [Dehalobacter sp.]